jgi:glutathione S-transferase
VSEAAENVSVYGAKYSVYTRIVRLALEMKGIAYRLVEIDIFGTDRASPDYAAGQPFRRIPAFEHDGFRLFESGAITRYIDEAFTGPALQPREPRARARMNQVISIMDAYAYRSMVWDLFVERVRVPAGGGRSDEAKIAAALPVARQVLASLTEISSGARWLAGDGLSLADIHAFPMVALFKLAPEGRSLIMQHSEIAGWFERFNEHPAAAATRFPVEQA